MCIWPFRSREPDDEAEILSSVTNPKEEKEPVGWHETMECG